MFNVKDYSNKDVVLKAGFVARYGLPHLLQLHQVAISSQSSEWKKNTSSKIS